MQVRALPARVSMGRLRQPRQREWRALADGSPRLLWRWHLLLPCVHHTIESLVEIVHLGAGPAGRVVQLLPHLISMCTTALMPCC